MKKLWILSVCLCLAFAMTACRQESENNEKDEETTTTVVTITTTTTTAESLDGTGGDLIGCRVHQPYYHTVDGNFTRKMFADWAQYYEEQIKPYEDSEDPEGGFTIVAFVECNNIARKDFPELAGWTTYDFWDGDLDKPCLVHYKDCPYTYNQFLDAIYGDDEELAEWVFSMETVRGLKH